MSYVFEANVGKYRYVYEGSSYRDGDKKPRNTRKPIGKVDPKTGQRIYYDEYIERMEKSGTPVEIPESVKAFTIEDIKKSSLREFGLFYLLQALADRVGLAMVMQEAMGNVWGEIFTLACYLVSSGDPFQYCENWVSNTECPPVGSLSSQRISELLRCIDQSDRDRFYQLWCACRCEREYLALDITSTSSYSELIDDVVWGHNRDNENLPQVNICMLVGEETRLPVYQAVYDGSLNDVKTLETTLASLRHITRGRGILAVMDKGFYSGANINEMLAAKSPIQFIISVPFKSALADALIDKARDNIDNVDNVIVVGSDSMRAATSEIQWGSKALYSHVYYSAKKAAGKREELYVHAALLKESAIAEPGKYSSSPAYKKYLRFTRTKNGYNVKIRHDVIEKELRHAGWLIVFSNKTSNAKKAIRIYRDKDVVEKGFLRFKNCLDMGRLRVHSEGRMQNKLFVGFIALIIMSEINRVMLNEGLYRNMTMRQLFLNLAKLRVQYVNGTRILFPVTKTQREIYKAFDVELPK